MILKTLYISLISFLIFLIPSLVIEKWHEYKGQEISFIWQSVFQILFYSIPIVGLGFLVLLMINFLTVYIIRKNAKLNRLSLYLLIAVTISLLPIFSCVIFDYLDRGRYFEEKPFVSIFFEYSPLLLWAVPAIFLNWRLFIKRFSFV